MAVDQRLLWLDLIRGMSAVAVAAGHLRLVMMCSYGELTDPTLPKAAFFVMTGLSSQAVMVFFVLSGFLVGGSALRQGPRFHMAYYLLTRIVRLWVVLIPALIWTLLVDSITFSIDPSFGQGDYFRRWTSGPAPGTYSTSLTTFVGNIAFVNTIYVNSFGSNGPLWSLACEFWYYILFPLFARAAGFLGPRPEWWRRIAYASLAVVILAMMPRTMQHGFCIWLMGLLVAVVVRIQPEAPSRNSIAFTVGAFVLSLAMSKLDHFGIDLPIKSHFLVGVCSALMILNLARLQRFPSCLKWLSSKLADISYSFYLVHFPVTVLIGVAVYSKRECQAGGWDILEYMAWFAVLLVITVPFWWCLERRTNDYRRYVQKFLDRLSSSKPLGYVELKPPCQPLQPSPRH